MHELVRIKLGAQLWYADGKTDRQTWRSEQSLFDILQTRLKWSTSLTEGFQQELIHLLSKWLVDAFQNSYTKVIRCPWVKKHGQVNTVVTLLHYINFFQAVYIYQGHKTYDNLRISSRWKVLWHFRFSIRWGVKLCRCGSGSRRFEGSILKWQTVQGEFFLDILTFWYEGFKFL